MNVPDTDRPVGGSFQPSSVRIPNENNTLGRPREVSGRNCVNWGIKINTNLPIDAVGRCKDPLLGDQGSRTENRSRAIRRIIEKCSDPWQFVNRCRCSSQDSFLVVDLRIIQLEVVECHLKKVALPKRQLKQAKRSQRRDPTCPFARQY